ncbi:hypothetical protein [Neptuniibacter sp.]|uniref:hypothetical protein n=1 Tax=Neptuniibacter sp. TaxID=1962643 RepID=UPI00262DB0CA|nr:hypothetical protein [Neptuniibacter sp.]MCP4594856.1 hypothetical protein [Neptuniibacter sp.]
MSEENLQQAIAAIKAGNKKYAEQLLTQILEVDDNNEDAWLGMAVCVDDSQLKRECLQRALEINPNSELAKRGLQRLNMLSKVKSSKRRKKKGKKKTRNLTLVLVACIVVVCCVAVAIASGSRTPPTASLRTAWINGIDKCPDSIEYGQLVMEAVNLYSNQDTPIPPLAHIPHGAQIEVLEEAANPLGLCKVRYDNQEGYVQNMFVVDYDPTQEDGPDKCY